MATARPPFTGATSVDVIYKHMNHAVPPIHKQPGADDCPPALEQVILRCLEKNRDERYGSMGELVVALKEIQRAITGHPPGTESISIGPTSWSVRPPIPAGDTVPVPEPRAAAAIEEHRTARGRVDAGAREAAFRDDGIHDLSDDATPSVSQARSGTRGKRRSHAPFVMAALGSLTALIALAALVWVETRSAPPPAAQAPAAPPPARAPAPAPAPSPSPDPPPPQQQPATTEAAVSFDSVPTGAEVLENGALLGETPFVLKLPLSAPRMFVFRAPGHRDTAVLAGIDRPEVRVRGVLEPIPVKAKKTAKRTEEPETEDGPEEREDREDRDRKKKPNYYRDNPY
jgi:serine/threonine-protein kinase